MYVTQFRLSWSLLKGVSDVPLERVTDALRLLAGEYLVDHFRVVEIEGGLVITLFVQAASATAAEQSVEPFKDRLLQVTGATSGPGQDTLPW